MADARDLLWQAIQLLTQARKELKEALTEERIREIVADEIRKGLIHRPMPKEKGNPRTTLEGDELIRADDLAPLLSISKQTLWRWVQRRGFPAPVKLSPRASAWKKEDVRAWLAQHGKKPRRGKS